MAFSLVLPLLALSAVSFASEVPVYMFGDIAKSALKYSPLSTVLKDEFSGILREELAKDPFTVIFIEETLSVEDLSLKNEDGESAFPFLRANIQDSAYLPSVDNALQALNQLADPEKVDHVKLTENGLSAEIEPESGKFLFINLKDAKEGESRADLLRRHNDFMEDMFSKLQQRYNKLVAVYTARFPSWTVSAAHSRVRRQTTETHVAGSYNFTGFLMNVSTIELVWGTQRPVLLTNGAGSSAISGNEMNSTLDFGEYKLMLHFTQVAGYWILNGVTVSNATTSEPVRPQREVLALQGFSYRCAPNVTFAADNQTTAVTLTFRDMKLQAFIGNLSSSDYQFGDSFNCVGFFSAPIWAGLFVTFLFLAITFYGIMMIMDIRTMDRFDDPKGKTITINTSE